MTDRREGLGLILDLAQAIQASGIYPSQHPRVTGLVDRLHARIVRTSAGAGGVHVGILGDHFVVDEFPFLDGNPALRRLAEDLREKGIERISFREGISRAELDRFVRFLATGTEPAEGKKWESISYGILQAVAGADLPPDGGSLVLSRSHVLYGAADVLKRVLEALALGAGGGPLAEGRDIVASILKGLRQDAFLLHRLMKMQAHDDYTVTHSLNVCAIVVAQARELGFPEERLSEIGLAAMLHDVGKEKVPSGILNKPGKVTPEEFGQIALHPASGANLLRKIDCGSDLPMIVAFEHHRKFDGSGYPKTFRPWDLHPVSHMTQIADVYDALRTFRPYRPSLDLPTTLSIMRKGRGTEFEPVLFDHFLRMLFAGRNPDEAGPAA